MTRIMYLYLGFLVYSTRRMTGMMGGGGSKGGRKSGIFGFGQSYAKVVNPSEIGVKFK